jgi:hypothetical protein
MEEHGHYLQDVFEHLGLPGFKLHPNLSVWTIGFTQEIWESKKPKWM